MDREDPDVAPPLTHAESGGLTSGPIVRGPSLGLAIGPTGTHDGDAVLRIGIVEHAFELHSFPARSAITVREKRLERIPAGEARVAEDLPFEGQFGLVRIGRGGGGRDRRRTGLSSRGILGFQGHR